MQTLQALLAALCYNGRQVNGGILWPLHFAQCEKEEADVPACSEFLMGDNPAEMFATQEYLTKKLLQHVLNMELLPEITISDIQIK